MITVVTGCQKKFLSNLKNISSFNCAGFALANLLCWSLYLKCAYEPKNIYDFLFLAPLAISDTYITYHQEHFDENISKKKQDRIQDTLTQFGAMLHSCTPLKHEKTEGISIVLPRIKCNITNFVIKRFGISSRLAELKTLFY